MALVAFESDPCPVRHSCDEGDRQRKLYMVIVSLADKAIERNPDLPGPWLTLSHYAVLERRWMDADLERKWE